MQVFERTKSSMFINHKSNAQTTIAPEITRCKDGGLLINTKLKTVHIKENMKLIWCILIICFTSILVLTCVTVHQETDLLLTKQNVVLLNQQLKSLNEMCGKLNRNILEIRLKTSERGQRNYHKRKLDIPEKDENSGKDNINTNVELTGLPFNIAMDTAPTFFMDINKIDKQLVPKSTKVDNKINEKLNFDTLVMSKLKMDHMLYNLSGVNESNTDIVNLPLTLTEDSGDIISKIINTSTSDITVLPSVDSSTETIQENVLKYFVKFEELNLKRSEEEDTRKGREKRSNRRGPVAAHFKGGQPETFIQDGGLVAPWFPDGRASGDFYLSTFQLREGKGTVEVSESGLYMIYAQVYYLTSDTLNSFSINVREAQGLVTPLAYCSANAFLSSNRSVTEVSCYTSVVRFLNATNQIFLKQRDRNRRMILRDGHSFLGLIKLNSHAEKGRRGE